MGRDKIRHLAVQQRTDGSLRYYWKPSATIQKLGMCLEALGTDPAGAYRRAMELNVLADEIRRSAKAGCNGPLPGTVSRLFADFKASDEYLALKPRTQSDYAYYLDKIEADMGHVMVRALTPRVIKTLYKRVKNDVSLTWAYHILATTRVALSWAVSEDWIDSNPALEVKLAAPKRRTVIWTFDQAQTYIAKAADMGWPSIVAMAHVFDSIGQSPIDVRSLLRKSYDGLRIDVTRAKTGRTDAPIRLFPTAKAALDAYLATQPAMLPTAPMFTNDKIGGVWNESTLQKVHRKIRAAAGLPSNLQLQDFRTTVQTEGGAAGGTMDELRGLARHSTRDAGEHYVIPDERFVDAIQDKRLALRNKSGAKVEEA